MKGFTFVAPEPDGPLAGGPVPTFSVIIAAYQAADVIGDAIESALEQTEPPLEVIVCDDGSTDDIERALRSYRDRIVLLRKENGGEASAKNAASRAASGDFVVILDADDVFLPERLEALGELARARPDLDILTTDATLEVDGRVVRRCYTDAFRFEVADQRRGILEQNFVFGLAAARRERAARCRRLRRVDPLDCRLGLLAANDLRAARVPASSPSLWPATACTAAASAPSARRTSRAG